MILLKQLDWLVNWWYANCDGEHTNGVTITTMDNPGWMVDFDLSYTPLSDTHFEMIETQRSEHDWVACSVKEHKFFGYGGPENLTEVFEVFRNWAEGNRQEGLSEPVDKDQFDWLARWFHSMCDGDWEHTYGVTITTLDKPGWRVYIDLIDTPWSEIDFPQIDDHSRSEHDWIACKVQEDVLLGEGGPENLSEIFEIFRKWVDENTAEWPSNSIEHIHEFFILRDGYKSGENKDVWEQCANILAQREDQMLLPDSSGLLKWLRDLSWPGARTILERLKTMSASPMFVYEVKTCIKQALARDEQLWLDNLSGLLDNELLKEKLPEELLAVLKRHYI